MDKKQKSKHLGKSVNFYLPPKELIDFDNRVGKKQRSEALRGLVRLYNTGGIRRVDSHYEYVEVKPTKK